jgi:hypothetical protein
MSAHGMLNPKASPSGFELEAIAAVVIGGTSLMGGRGSVVNSLFEVLVISVLENGLAQLGAQEPVVLRRPDFGRSRTVAEHWAAAPMERVLDEAKGPHQQTRNKRCREDVELIPEPHTSRATGLGRCGRLFHGKAARGRAGAVRPHQGESRAGMSRIPHLRGSPPRKAPLIFSGVMDPMLLHSPNTLSRRRALCRAARPKGAPLGPGNRSLDWLHLRDLR